MIIKFVFDLNLEFYHLTLVFYLRQDIHILCIITQLVCSYFRIKN